MDTRFLALGVIALGLHGQQTVTRVVFVAVTDSVNRFVTGLEHSHFAISENGLQRPIVSIATPDESVAIAIVTDHDIPIGATARDGAELHQMRSVAEALRSLASSSAAREGAGCCDRRGGGECPRSYIRATSRARGCAEGCRGGGEPVCHHILVGKRDRLARCCLESASRIAGAESCLLMSC
jgi:hypothetical protein